MSKADLQSRDSVTERSFRSRRRTIAAGVCALAFAAGCGLMPGLAAAQQAAAQPWPSGTVRLVVAYAAGGSTDIVARMFAAELATELGQSVVVENRPGGGTLIATEHLRRAPADGSVFLYGTNAFVITPLLNPAAKYDPVGEFTQVAVTTVQSLGMMLTPGLNIRTVRDFIAYAKANPGKVNFASSGNGSAQHLAGEAFARAAGIRMTHVPYKGAGPAAIDLIGGRVDVMFASLVGNTKQIEEGRIVLAATTGLKRSAATPKVPTVAESGVPGYETLTFQGLIAPGGVPRAIVDRMNAALVKVGARPAITEKLAAQGMEVSISTPEEMRSMFVRETTTYKAILADLGPLQ
jgi:tripartite-type tricarboxylate transporter receptor subunit TctC